MWKMETLEVHNKAGMARTGSQSYAPRHDSAVLKSEKGGWDLSV